MEKNQLIQNQNPNANKLVSMERNISERVANRVQELVKSGRINLPANYSVGNALSSAWLTLQNVKDPQGRRALEVCTKESVANALLDMAIMGLNPAKKQGYFIPYGDQMAWFTSYFGKCAVVKRLKGIETEPVATIIYEGDEIELAFNELGEEYVKFHKTTWQNKQKGVRVGAYATVKQGNIIRSAVMTRAEIKEAWTKNPSPKNKRDHVEFEGEFMKRTVINRLVKMIIQTSNDDDLLAETMIVNEDKHYDFEGQAEAIAANEVKELANTGEIVDIPLDAEEIDTLGEVEQVVEFAEEPQPIKQQEPTKQTVTRSRPF
jgi:recombination protein RecT